MARDIFASRLGGDLPALRTRALAREASRALAAGNRSRHVEGLYLAGGAAHPGPGMPIVLMSGWIAADALDKDVRARKTAA